MAPGGDEISGPLDSTARREGYAFRAPSEARGNSPSLSYDQGYAIYLTTRIPEGERRTQSTTKCEVPKKCLDIAAQLLDWHLCYWPSAVAMNQQR